VELLLLPLLTLGCRPRRGPAPPVDHDRDEVTDHMTHMGTAAQVAVLCAAVYGYASRGPTSLRSEYRRRVDAALATPQPGALVADADLAHLPAPVAAYVRRCSAVGQPRVVNFHARIHGRIRGGADRRWMPFTGEQVNTYGPVPTRLFLLDKLQLSVNACATLDIAAQNMLARR
jgi:hypothetical protein